MSDQRVFETDPVTGDVTTTYKVPTTTAPERLLEDDDPKRKVPCPECGKSVQQNYLQSHRRSQHGVFVRARRKPEPRPGRPPKVKKLPGNDVVTTVLEVVFPRGIPARHLEAVIQWREQTIEFMERVQR